MKAWVTGSAIIWFTFSGLSSDARGQDEKPKRLFPDAALESAVRRQVYEKRHNDEPLTEKDVERVAVVEGRGLGIESLEGLQHCKALALLDLEENAVRDLTPLKDLARCQSLNVAGNKLTDLSPIAGWSKLQYLDVSRNQLTSVAPLAELTAMRTLYLSSNALTSLDALAKLTRLTSLHFDDNAVVDLAPLANLTRLASLGAARNGIEDLTPLMKARDLRFLMLEGNRLTTLDVLVAMADGDEKQRFAPYWRLYLSHNPLSDAAQSEQVAALRARGGQVEYEPAPPAPPGDGDAGLRDVPSRR